MSNAIDIFLERAAAYLDGELAADEHDAFDAELLADPEKRRRFVDICLHSATLAETFSQSLARPSSPMLSEAKRRGRDRVPGSGFRKENPQSAIRNPQFAIILTLAAAVVLAVTAWFFLPEPRTLNPEPVKATSPSFAMLSDLSADAAFADSTGSLALGADLTSGPIHLTAGKAQLMFKSGAVVDLTGPCEFEMTGPNQGRFTRGRLHAYVPDSALGFTLAAPRGVKVVDLGTEFTMRVLASGESFVLVHQGRVRLSSAMQQRLLGTGQSLVAAAGGRLRQALTDEFPELHPIGRLHPLAWWRLASIMQGVAPNTMTPLHAARLEGSAGLMEDPVRPGLRLDRGSRVRVFEGTSKQPIREALTFVAWVKWEGGGPWQRVFDFGHDSQRSMFFTPNAEDTGRPRFAVTTRGYAGEHRADCPAPMPRDRWVMLAVTLADGDAAVYLDGEPIARNNAVPLAPGELLGADSFIGASQYPEDPTFNGLIADAAVFDRALTESEIRNLHQQTQASPEEASER